MGAKLRRARVAAIAFPHQDSSLGLLREEEARGDERRVSVERPGFGSRSGNRNSCGRCTATRVGKAPLHRPVARHYAYLEVSRSGKWRCRDWYAKRQSGASKLELEALLDIQVMQAGGLIMQIVSCDTAR